MNKINFNRIKGFLPLTIQNANIVSDETVNQLNNQLEGITASNYQSDDVNPQQFYKPISKILQF